MATKDLATVRGITMQEAVNLIAESEGEIVRLPFSEVKQEMDAELNELKGALVEETTARQNAVSTEKSERKSEIAVERARIDTFVSLQEGSTTGDAELLDARIDHDGTVHNCVGDAIRYQTGKLDEDLTELKPLVINNLSYEYTGTIPKFVKYNMVNGHSYLFKNESSNFASFSVSDVLDGELTNVVQNLVGNTSVIFKADKNYSYIKVYVQGGGLISVIDQDTMNEKFSETKELGIDNRNNILIIKNESKKMYLSKNCKVDFDKYIGKTFSDFRGSEPSPIIVVENHDLANDVEYSWNLQCSTNNAIQYGSNITMSVGIKDGDNIEWLVDGILANQSFSSPKMHEANVFKFNTTSVWRSAVDSQTITYINIYKKSDGNHYDGFAKTIKNDSVNWWANKIGDSLGDSLTGQGFFQKWTRRYFDLLDFKNHGIGGTKLSGSANEYGDSMWMDSRINSLDENADFITILGGQNDVSVNIGDLTLDNHDTNTFAGAFNVIISKLYYKYLALDDGYYADVDYSGITKATSPHNIIIIPCTPFFVPNTTQNLEEKANAIRALANLWSLNVADFRAKAQSSMPLRNVYWGTDTTHPQEIFYKERIAPLLIGVMEELKPIDWEETFYGYET